jgi:hypothetical protein
LAALRAGTARSLTQETSLDPCIGFDCIWLGGGGAQAWPLPWRTVVSDAGRFCGEAGGLALAPGACVVDVGQTGVKVSFEGRRAVHERAGRSIEELLRVALAGVRGRPPAVVIGLPCHLDAAGLPGPSTYAGLERRPEVVDDAVAAAGWRDVPVWVINDAELAALSARQSPEVRAGERTLVVTVGFGVGGAVLTP